MKLVCISYMGYNIFDSIRIQHVEYVISSIVFSFTVKNKIIRCDIFVVKKNVEMYLIDITLIQTDLNLDAWHSQQHTMIFTDYGVYSIGHSFNRDNTKEYSEMTVYEQ